MRLPTTLIVLAFLALMGACTSEQATPDEFVEPTAEGETVSEQPALETRQAMPSRMQEPQVGDEVQDGCTPPPPMDDVHFDSPFRGGWVSERYIRWSPDGSRILFNGSAVYDYVLPAPDLYYVAPNGARLDKIVNVGNEAEDPRSYDWVDDSKIPIRQIVNVQGIDPIWGDGGQMMHFDISPDSFHIVYSTCAYTEDAERDPALYSELVVLDMERPEDTEPTESSKLWFYNYEIVLSDIDGGNVRRLTTNLHHDNFPVWSPDGARIAFMTQKRGGDQLTIYTVETGSLREFALPLGISFAEHRMAWSPPDGESIAFVVHGSQKAYPSNVRVYVAGFDDLDGDEMPSKIVTRGLWQAASGPAWSPDGRRIAVVIPESAGVALYTFDADGSDPVLVTDNLPEPWPYLVNPWLGDLVWSPDGSEILLKSFTYRVPLDGSPPIGSPLTYIDRDDNSQVAIPMDASWSPDGSMLAVRIDDVHMLPEDFVTSEYSSLVYLIDRDNTDIRPLVGYGEFVPHVVANQWVSYEIELRLAE